MNNSTYNNEILSLNQREWLEQVVSVYVQYQQFEKAEPLLKLLVKLDPSNVRLLKRLSFLHYSLGRYERAVKICGICRVRSNEGEDTSAIDLLESYSQLKLGNKKQAARCYQDYQNKRTIQ